jgi:uncharacterized membrane protein
MSDEMRPTITDPAAPNTDCGSSSRANSNIVAWRNGVTLLGSAVFAEIACLFLPADQWRWMFVGFSVVMLFAALWQIERANRALTEATRT